MDHTDPFSEVTCALRIEMPLEAGVLGHVPLPSFMPRIGAAPGLGVGGTGVGTVKLSAPYDEVEKT
ncbi:hypothetical protein GCM10009642_67650 [Nocardiopsis metallicus]